MQGSLFISYSHLDTLWMHAFRKHLTGILMDGDADHEGCNIWTDEDIAAGSTWQEKLLGNLRQAAAALILVSPDYLVSPWCRRELKTLAEARKSNQLTAVYWVLLKPCGWKWTELAGLQAVEGLADLGLLGIPEGPQRDTQLLRCCETVAASFVQSLKSEDEVLATIRAILSRSKQGSAITPIKTLAKGDFSIVGRGVDSSGNDLVIKVLTSTPLHNLRDLFLLVSQACWKINVPSVVRTLDVFTDGDGYDKRIVIVSEMAGGEALSDVMAKDATLPPSQRHLTLDNIGVLLRRVAEGLEALHAIELISWEGGDEGHFRHLMGPLLPSSIYYDRATQRPRISLVGVTNFLWRFFEPGTFRRIVGSGSPTYPLPERSAGISVDVRADQYFLGLLALELLEGKGLFNACDHPPDPLDIVSNAAWAKRHAQLGALVCRLLAEDPKKRFSNMTDVLANLRALEDSSRALAKYSFRRYVAPESQGDSAGMAFSQAFYQKFFSGIPTVKQLFLEAHRQRTPGTEPPVLPDQTQHRKLMDGLKAVLNFRPGADPSSIDSVAARHAGFRLDEPQLKAFEAAFIETLVEHAAAESAADVAEITEAWSTLFAVIRPEMLRQPVPGRAATV